MSFLNQLQVYSHRSP